MQATPAGMTRELLCKARGQACGPVTLPAYEAVAFTMPPGSAPPPTTVFAFHPLGAETQFTF
jgi:hypothetical protein